MIPLGEPRCGLCGTSMADGLSHFCKPAWDEEFTKLKLERDALKAALKNLLEEAYPSPYTYQGCKCRQEEKCKFHIAADEARKLLE